MHIRYPDGIDAGWIFVLSVRPEEESFVEEFMGTLPDQEIEKFYARFGRLNSLPPFDHRCASSNFKKLTGVGDLYEICTYESRLLGFRSHQVLVLTNGFRKKTNQTPRDQIKVCQTRRKQYLDEVE